MAAGKSSVKPSHPPLALQKAPLLISRPAQKGIYASPKPRVVFQHYAMGGNLFSDHWLAVKDRPAPLRGGADQITRESLAHLLDKPQQPISYSPMVIFGDEGAEMDVGRGKMLGLFWQEGCILDYQLGRPGISAELRKLPEAERSEAVPEVLRPAVLQVQLREGFPATVLVHGDADELVLVEESTRTCERLRECGVRSELLLVKGGEHTFVDRENFPNLVAGAMEVNEKGFKFVLEELLK